ncbi:MAG: hypothetical protein ABSF36_08895 [Candidatus Methanomethylicaceae archaeon]|jgi:hypothetical protein
MSKKEKPKISLDSTCFPPVPHVKPKPEAKEVSPPMIHIEGTVVVKGEKYSFQGELPLTLGAPVAKALCTPRTH